MKKSIKLMMVLLGFSFIQSTQAVSVAKALSIAKQNACFSCHSQNRKLIGPSFEEIAIRYKTNSTAIPILANSIKRGSARKWGMIPMPAHPKMSEADALIVSEWIMFGK